MFLCVCVCLVDSHSFSVQAKQRLFIAQMCVFVSIQDAQQVLFAIARSRPRAFLSQGKCSSAAPTNLEQLSSCFSPPPRLSLCLERESWPQAQLAPHLGVLFPPRSGAAQHTHSVCVCAGFLTASRRALVTSELTSLAQVNSFCQELFVFFSSCTLSSARAPLPHTVFAPKTLPSAHRAQTIFPPIQAQIFSRIFFRFFFFDFFFDFSIVFILSFFVLFFFSHCFHHFPTPFALFFVFSFFFPFFPCFVFRLFPCFVFPFFPCFVFRFCLVSFFIFFLVSFFSLFRFSFFRSFVFLLLFTSIIFLPPTSDSFSST